MEEEEEALAATGCQAALILLLLLMLVRGLVLGGTKAGSTVRCWPVHWPSSFTSLEGPPAHKPTSPLPPWPTADPTIEIRLLILLAPAGNKGPQYQTDGPTESSKYVPTNFVAYVLPMNINQSHPPEV